MHYADVRYVVTAYLPAALLWGAIVAVIILAVVQDRTRPPWD